MAFPTKKFALAWAKHHLRPTKYGNFYDPIHGTETRPVKRAPGIWSFEGRNNEWLDEVEALGKGGDE